MSVYLKAAPGGYVVGVRDTEDRDILAVQFEDTGSAQSVAAAFMAARAYANRLEQVVLTYN